MSRRKDRERAALEAAGAAELEAAVKLAVEEGMAVSGLSEAEYLRRHGRRIRAVVPLAMARREPDEVASMFFADGFRELEEARAFKDLEVVHWKSIRTHRTGSGVVAVLHVLVLHVQEEGFEWTSDLTDVLPR